MYYNKGLILLFNTIDNIFYERTKYMTTGKKSEIFNFKEYHWKKLLKQWPSKWKIKLLTKTLNFIYLIKINSWHVYNHPYNLNLMSNHKIKILLFYTNINQICLFKRI